MPTRRNPPRTQCRVEKEDAYVGLARNVCPMGPPLSPSWDLAIRKNNNQTPPFETQHPPFVKLAICSGKDKSSEDITREFDDIAIGQFYSRDFSRDGSCFVGEGDWYDAGWWFQKLEDLYTFIKKYGGTPG